MNIEQFVSMDNDETMSSQQANQLNTELSKLSAKDLPASYHGAIIDYLVTALNINSVDQELVGALDSLLESLQND